MSLYINFHGKWVDEHRVERKLEWLLGYPIAVVPVKYWTVREHELHIVGKKILELVREGANKPEVVSSLLGLTGKLEKIVFDEWDHLQALGLLEQKQGGTWITSYEGNAAYSEVLEDGYLIYDLLRGTFFPYIHQGDVFLTSDKKMKTVINSLQPNIELTKKLFEAESFRAKARQAARTFSHMTKEWLLSGEQTDELLVIDQPEAPVETQYRIELKPFSFVQKGFMVVRLKGDVVNRGGNVHIHAISPFTNRRSHSLYAIIEAQEEGKRELEIFREYILEEEYRELETMFAMDPRDLFDRVYAEIANHLEGSKVTNAVLEYLEVAEKDYQKMISQNDIMIGERASQINNWNLAMEAYFSKWMEKYEDLRALPEWGKFANQQQAASYLQTRLYDIWQDLPIAIQHNTKQILVKLRPNQPISSVRPFGNRDRVGLILLSELTMREQQAADQPIFISMIRKHPSLLHKLDRIISLRNQSGGHYNANIAQLSHAEFLEFVQETRQNVYEIIRTFANA
ncbi:hypothetical protein [Brevibacillus agri]|uniref:hypothetical protein n=1 Tax=Brevibacillus agri TaxID=51101 RepID=UPI003D22B163